MATVQSSFSLYLATGAGPDGPGISLDAVCFRPQTGSFKLSAIRSQTYAKSVFLNGILLSTQSASVSINAAKSQTSTRTFAVNAFRSLSQSGSFVLAATQAQTSTKTFSVNAVVLKSRTGSFATASTKSQTWVKTFGLTAVRISAQAGTVSLSATKAQASTKALSLDANVRSNQLTLILFDAVRLKGQTGAFFISATKSQSSTRTFGLVAVRGVTQSGLISVSSTKSQTSTQTFNLNAVRTKGQTGAFALSAARAQTSTATTALNSVRARPQTGTFTLAAAKAQSSTKTFGLNATIRRTQQRTFAVDWQWLFPGGTIQRTTTLDAYKQDGPDGPGITLDAIRFKAQTGTFSVFAYKQQTVTKTVNLNANVVGTPQKSFSLDWQWFVSGGTIQRTTTLDAFVYAPVATRTGSFTVNAHIPTTFGSFTVSAMTTGKTKTKSFVVYSEKVKFGEKRKQLLISSWVAGRIIDTFNLSAYKTTWRQKAFFINAFVRLTFTLDAYKRPSATFALNARKGYTKTFDAKSVKKTTVDGSAFGIRSVTVTATGGGYKEREVFFNATKKATVTGRTYINTFIAKRILINSRVAPWFRIDAKIRNIYGGTNQFFVNAYVKSDDVLVFTDGGGATDPVGAPPPVSRKYDIRIWIGLRNPSGINTQLANYWYANVVEMARYVQTYWNVPEERRTDAQTSALATDLATLAYDVEKYRQAAAIPVTWTDYTANVLYEETSFTQVARVGVGTFNLALKGSFPEIKGGEEIRVEIDGYRVFGGYITQIENTYFFEAKRTPKTVLRGTDYNSLVDRMIVYNSISNLANYYTYKKNYGGYYPPLSYAKRTSDKDIITDVIGKYMAFEMPADFNYTQYVDAVDTPAPVTNWVLPTSGSNLRQTLQSISQITNAVWYIDPYMALHYHDRSLVTAPYSITDGAGGISCRGLSVTTDISSMKNDVIVWGTLARTVSGEIMYYRELADGYSDVRYWLAKVNQMQKYVNTYLALSTRTAAQQKALETDQKTLAYNKTRLAEAIATTEDDSVAKYGRWQSPEFRSDIHHQEWVEKRAMSIVSRYGQPITTAQATVYEPGFSAGQVVTVKSNAYGVSASLVIRQMTISFPVSKGPKSGKYYTVPQYDLLMGLDPEAGWNIYDYLPFEGIDLDTK